MESAEPPALPDVRPGTAVIAANVRRLRDQLNWSGADLAVRVQDQGLNWTRTTVAKLETGRREAVAVHELLALAIALGVPPVWLLVDPTDGRRTLIADQAGGTVGMGPWTAFQWLTGQSYADVVPGDWPQLWDRAAGGLDLGYRIGQLLRQLHDINDLRETTDLVQPGKGEDEDFLAAERKGIEQLRRRMQELVDRGLRPPTAHELGEHVLKKAAQFGVELPTPPEAGP